MKVALVEAANGHQVECLDVEDPCDGTGEISVDAGELYLERGGKRARDLVEGRQDLQLVNQTIIIIQYSRRPLVCR